MCDLTENGWDEHKKVVYHKIDANTEYLEKVSIKQDQILERIHIRDSKDIAEDMKRARFEARMEEKVNRMANIVYGALGAATFAVILQVLNLVFNNGGSGP